MSESSQGSSSRGRQGSLSFSIALTALPDLQKVGGNARPGHGIVAYRNRQAEKDKWKGLILEQCPRHRLPRFGRAYAEVTLYFAQRRKRDRENLAIALKPLWDALVDLEIIPDDDYDHLDYGMPMIIVDKEKAPMTEIILKRREE